MRRRCEPLFSPYRSGSSPRRRRWRATAGAPLAPRSLNTEQISNIYWLI
jgi:hypothetical protein